MTPPPRRARRGRVAGALLGAALLAPAPPAAALEGGFAPPGAPETRRGAAVAERFELGRRFVLELEVANAFSAQNQAAIPRAEARVAAVPGVRQVIGPAGLSSFTVDHAGHVAVAPLRAGAAGEPELARRLAARADATGWFVAPDGSTLRMLIDTAAPARVHGPVEAAVASSGLVLLNGAVASAPLWPNPERDDVGFGRRTPLGWALLLLALPFVAVAAEARPASRRAWLCVLGAALGTALPGITAPVAGLRWYALMMGGVAAALLIAILVLGASARRLRGRREAPLRRRGAPPALLLPAVLLMAVAAVRAPLLRMDTGLWSHTPLFFVDVRADLGEPVVLRELRRLTDLLRDEPGVDDAWSVADLFGGVPLPDVGGRGIPAAPAQTRAVLKRARVDPAVALEVTPDLQEALIVVRLDPDAGLTPARVRRRISALLEANQRPALLRLDVTDPSIPFAARALGRGTLAEDAIARVTSLCDQAGRNLEPAQLRAIEASLRRVALAPELDLAQYRRDAARAIETAVEEAALAAHHVTRPQPAQRQRLIGALLAAPDQPSLAEVLRGMGDVLGPRTPPAVVQAKAEELRRRLGALRQRAVVARYAKAILADADLPTEGGLSDQVRDATLEAMGPIAGVPVARGTPHAFSIDAAVAGGVVSDQVLSARWPPRLRLGLLAAAAACALLLAALGGRRALAWLPIALAPAALVLIVPTLLGVSTSALFAAVLSGAVGGGIVFALAYAPARGEG